MRLALERFLEDELSNYRKNVYELNLLREEIIEGGPGPADGMPRGNTTSNPTESKAARLMTSNVILCLERRLKAVARVLDKYQNNPEMLRLIDLRYIKGTHTAIGVMNELHISSKTFYRWRRELLECLATEMGYN